MKAEFDWQVDSGCGTFSIRRPDRRNALSRSLLHEMFQTLESAGRDESLRVFVLASEGPVFCAGMDLKEMQSRVSAPDPAAEWSEDSRAYAAVLRGLHAIPCPTIAAVQGPVVAGGAGLVAACDFVIASGRATFSLPEPQRGIVAAMVTPFLIRRIGFGPALRLLLAGETWTADQALQFGLCHAVVPMEQLLVRVAELVRTIQQGAPSANALTKAFANRCQGDSILEQLEIAMDVSAEARSSLAAEEGRRAFLEKRTPSWQSTTTASHGP